MHLTYEQSLSLAKKYARIFVPCISTFPRSSRFFWERRKSAFLRTDTIQGRSQDRFFIEPIKRRRFAFTILRLLYKVGRALSLDLSLSRALYSQKASYQNFSAWIVDFLVLFRYNLNKLFRLEIEIWTRSLIFLNKRFKSLDLSLRQYHWKIPVLTEAFTRSCDTFIPVAERFLKNIR